MPKMFEIRRGYAGLVAIRYLTCIAQSCSQVFFLCGDRLYPPHNIGDTPGKKFALLIVLKPL